MCDQCGWEAYKELAADLADRGSTYAQDMLDTWFGGDQKATHVTAKQIAALERTELAFDVRDEHAWDEMNELQYRYDRA